MAFRNGTYIAFDGLGQTNPTLSDFKYYSTIQAWASNKSIDFNYIDSHDKTYAVKDSSKLDTLKSRIRERLSNSKNVVVILSSQTRASGSMLSYEIEQAIDVYKIPLIITYVDYQIIADPSYLKSYWPVSLEQRISMSTARAIHIPFMKDAMLDAINQFNLTNQPNTSLNYYTEQAHRTFGCMIYSSSFVNKLKDHR